MRKREDVTVLKRISVLLCRFKPRFACDLLLLVVLYCKHLFCNTITHNANDTIDNMLTDRWTLSIQSFTFIIILPSVRTALDT